MGLEVSALFMCFMVPVSAVTSAYALIFLLSRSRVSRVLGIISLAFVSVMMLTPTQMNRRPLSLKSLGLFGLCTMPAIIGIVFNRAPRFRPGHCSTCGYNLTGNSGAPGRHLLGVRSECR